MHAFMIPIALLAFAAAMLLARSVKSFAATLLLSWVVSLLLCYVDKDTHSLSALFTPRMLWVGAVFTFLISGVLTAVNRYRLSYALDYVTLLVLSFLLAFLFRSVYSAGVLSLSIFAILALCYLIHDWVQKRFKLAPR